MKIKVNIDGKTVKGRIPDRWEELTVKQYTAIMDSQSITTHLSALTGLDEYVIENTKQNLTPVLIHVSKLINSFPDPNNIGGKVDFELMGRKVRPRDIKDLTWLQKDMIKDKLVEEDSNDFWRHVSFAFAVWVMPSIIGCFETKRLDEFIREVEQLPVKTVMPWCTFFFRKLEKEKINLLMSLNQSLQP